MRSVLIQQQTQIESRYQAWLVNYAKEKDILIRDLWIRSINNLLALRLEWEERGAIPSYRARSRTDLVPWSVRLPEKLVNQVNAAVEEDHASVRTFYYTALMHFVADHSESDK